MALNLSFEPQALLFRPATTAARAVLPAQSSLRNLFPALLTEALRCGKRLALSLLLSGAGMAVAQSVATPAALADCTVPHFTVAASSFGEVSTRSQGLDCIGRQRALVFFGRTARQMEGDANGARTGAWTANGERWGREAADLAVKNSLLKNGIDVLVAKVRYNAEVAKGDRGKALTKATLGLLKEGTVFASRVFCANGGSCSPGTESSYKFVAESLKVAAQVPACADRNAAKCVEAIRSVAKLYDIAQALSGRPATTDQMQQWSQFLAEWISGSVDLARAAANGNGGAALAASGDLVETTLNTFTSKYFRADGDLPSGMQNSLEILGNATATWTACKGAEMAVATLRPGEISAASADCMSKLNEYANTRLAEIMGYSMVLFQASKEQYQASTIDGARVVIGEVLRLGGWEPTFKSYGLVVDERTVLAASKDLRITQAVTRIAARYQISHSGVASLHSNWWDGWAGDVLRLIQMTYWPAIQSGTQALVAAPPVQEQFAGVRFDAPAPTVVLERPTSGVWNALSPFPVKVRATLPNRGVSLQLLGLAGQIVAATSMTQLAPFGSAAEQWTLDLSAGTAFARVPDGLYSLRAAAVSMDNKAAWSALEGVTVQRAAQATLAVRLISANTVSRPDGLLTVRAEASAAAGQPPVLVVTDSRGAAVFQAPFNLKLTAAASTEPWQYAAPVNAAMKPGDYTLSALLQLADGRRAVSASLPLRIEPLAAPPAPSPLPAAPPAPAVPPPAAAPNPVPVVPGLPAPVIVQLTITPQPAQSGQTLTFTAVLDRAAEIVRGELVFVDAGGVSEPLVQTGPAIWSHSRPLNQIGANRQVEVRLLTRSGAWIARAGSYSVGAAPISPALPPTPAPPPAPSPVQIPAISGLQPWQQSALAFVNNYLEGRARWTDCWDAGAGRRGTYCYRFARQAVGLPAMGSAIDAFESLHDQGRSSTAGFDTAPVGALIFYRIGTYGHVAVKVSATEVAGHGNELAFTATCPPITRVAHISLTARAGYAGHYAPGAGTVTLDPNVIPAGQRVTRQAFLQQLLSAVRAPVDPAVAGIIQGGSLSEPGRAITRGEAFLLLGRALTRLAPALPTASQAALPFADASAGEATTLLGVLSAHGIVQGQANELAAGVNAFPDRQLSVAELQALMGRASLLLATKQGTTAPPPPAPPPAPPPIAIQQVTANPPTAQSGQAITFAVTVISPALLARAEVVFVDAGAPPEPMMQIGPSQWARTRPITQLGINRPFEVRLTSTSGAVVTQRGTYTVQAGPTPPAAGPAPAPTPAPTALAISNISVNANGSPVIVFDVRPTASRATLSIPGRTFQFTCSGGTRVTCVCTSLWAPALRGTFAAQIEAFDGSGRSSGAVPFIFSR